MKTSTSPSIFPLRVYFPRWTRGIYMLGILVCVYFTWLAFYVNQAEYALVFVSFIVIAIYGLITTYTITMVDQSAITIQTLRATYQLLWTEVTFVETNASTSSLIGNTIIFRGMDKTLVVDLTFKGTAGREMRYFFEQQISNLKIPIQSLHHFPLKHENTRIM